MNITHIDKQLYVFCIFSLLITCSCWSLCLECLISTYGNFMQSAKFQLKYCSVYKAPSNSPHHVGINLPTLALLTLGTKSL